MWRATASDTAPTDMVLVRRMGVSISPHSMTCVMPETSPAPLSTKPPPFMRSMKMLPRLGRMAVTPVRTGPCPGLSGPSPRMMVLCPTSTPSTSVMALYRPVLKRPSGMPSSRARTRFSGDSVSGGLTMRHDPSRGPLMVNRSMRTLATANALGYSEPQEPLRMRPSFLLEVSSWATTSCPSFKGQ